MRLQAVYRCGETHLHRYLAEFDFRYNHCVTLGIDDKARTVAAGQRSALRWS